MIMVIGQTLIDIVVGWYQDYSDQLKDGILFPSFKHFKQEMYSRFLKSSKAEDNL